MRWLPPALLALICLLSRSHAAEVPSPPTAPKGYQPWTQAYDGPAAAALTYAGGRWQRPPAYKGRISPWTALVVQPGKALNASPRKRSRHMKTASLSDILNTRPDRPDYAHFPPKGRAGGWVLLRNPAPIPITPALITRWDMFYPVGQPGLTAIPFGAKTPVNPNLPTWPPGALMWLLTGAPEVEVNPLLPFTVFPYPGFTREDIGDPLEDCHHLRLAVELSALSNPLGQTEPTELPRLCAALQTLAAAGVKKLSFPPGPPSGGRNERTLTGSFLMPAGANMDHPAIAPFFPAYAVSDPAARWVFKAPVSLFYWRNSLERANLLTTSPPPASPDGSFLALRAREDLGLTFALHTREGRCEEGCLIESVCLIRVHDNRIAAKAGNCD